jgi:hypothetical protein
LEQPLVEGQPAIEKAGRRTREESCGTAIRVKDDRYRNRERR